MKPRPIPPDRERNKYYKSVREKQNENIKFRPKFVELGLLCCLSE